MARISDRLVIQLVESKLVFVDDSTGAEVVVDKVGHQAVVDELQAAADRGADAPLEDGDTTVTVTAAEIPNALRAIEYLRQYA